MPVKLCLEPRCGNKAETRGRCRVHATEHRRYQRSPNDAFYGSKTWKMARRAKLLADPLCEYRFEDGTTCGRLADSVHHVVPLEDGGSKRDSVNLMSVCRPHHTAIHRAMDAVVGR